MGDFQKYVAKRSKRDPEFKKLWEENELKRELIKQIIALRNKFGMTQQELAEKLGTSQAAIARVESGRQNITIDYLARIAHALHLSVNVRFKATGGQLAGR